MAEQFYVHLFSGDATTSPGSFRSELPEALLLPGEWEVALCQLQVPKLKSKTSTLFLFSDICDDSIVGTRRLPLLRRTALPRRGVVEIYHFQYVPVRLQQLRRIQVHVNATVDESASFDIGAASCTLHFKKLS